MDLYPASPPVRFKIVLGPAIISWMDELIRSLCSPIQMPQWDASAFPSAILRPEKSRKKKELVNEGGRINLAIMKLACLVLRKKSGRRGVGVFCARVVKYSHQLPTRAR